MQIIIDGYNLIHAWGWMPNQRHPNSLAIGRQRMLSRLAQLVPSHARSRVIIVFDAGHWYRVANQQALNSNQRESDFGFDVRFANQYDEADTMIEDLIRQSSHPTQLLVVSSDQRLIQAAQRRRAESIRSPECLDKLEELFAGLDKSSAITSKEEEDVDESFKEELTQTLKDTDWMAEFKIQVDDDSADPNPKNKDGSTTYNPKPCNPFPPGYGEDLL